MKKPGRRAGYKEPRTLDAQVTFSRPSTTGGQSKITIRCEEPLSGCLVFELSLDPAEFADGIFGLGNRPAKLVLFEAAIEKLGKKAESKHVLVPTKSGQLPSAKDLAALEVDGWRVNEEEFNHHHYTPDGVGKGTYRVALHRWVDQW